jgi:hypothetical protein
MMVMMMICQEHKCLSPSTGRSVFGVQFVTILESSSCTDPASPNTADISVLAHDCISSRQISKLNVSVIGNKHVAVGVNSAKLLPRSRPLSSVPNVTFHRINFDSHS